MTLKPWLHHVHIHDGLLDLDELVFKPIGQGEIDHRPVVRILMEEGYDGVLSGEWLDWEAPELHLPRERLKTTHATAARVACRRYLVHSDIFPAELGRALVPYPISRIGKPALLHSA